MDIFCTEREKPKPLQKTPNVLILAEKSRILAMSMEWNDDDGQFSIDIPCLVFHILRFAYHTECLSSINKLMNYIHLGFALIQSFDVARSKLIPCDGHKSTQSNRIHFQYAFITWVLMTNWDEWFAQIVHLVCKYSAPICIYIQINLKDAPEFCANFLPAKNIMMASLFRFHKLHELIEWKTVH